MLKPLTMPEHVAEGWVIIQECERRYRAIVAGDFQATEDDCRVLYARWAAAIAQMRLGPWSEGVRHDLRAAVESLQADS